jgi:hypothetical protein
VWVNAADADAVVMMAMAMMLEQSKRITVQMERCE